MKKRFKRWGVDLETNTAPIGREGDHGDDNDGNDDGGGGGEKGGGRTAMHLACAAGADDLIKWLVKHGADVTAVDAAGNTPAHLLAPWAAVRPTTMDRLQRAGANVEGARNARGETPARLAEHAVQRHTSQKRAAEDKRHARREADTLAGGSEAGSGSGGAAAAVAAAERAWNAKLFSEAMLGEEMDEFGGGGGGAGGEAHADFFASYGDTANDPDAYSWHEEEEAYRRYMREGMAEKQKQQRRVGGYGGSFSFGAHAGAGGGSATTAADAQQRATRLRDEAAQQILDDERRKDSAWRAKLTAQTAAATAAAAGPSSADYRQAWGKAMAMADGGEELSYSDIPWPLSEREEKGSALNVSAVLRGVLLRGVTAADGEGGDAGAARRALRSEMLRWHPDKFEARLGRCVCAPDRERVAARVNVVAQLVADLFKQAK